MENMLYSESEILTFLGPSAQECGGSTHSDQNPRLVVGGVFFHKLRRLKKSRGEFPSWLSG